MADENEHFGWTPATVGAAVAVLAALTYLNALGNGLVWDDPIVLNRQLLAFRSLRDVIFTPRNIPQYSTDYYRPLTTASYLLDHAIAGSAPFMFHLSVIVYHVVATYLVFRLGLALFAAAEFTLLAAGLGAALFAVHPMHAESVAWGAGRSDVIATCFALAAALALLHRGWSAPRRGIGSAVGVFLAMLAKEAAVAMLVVLPLIGMLRPSHVAPTPPPGGRAQRRRQRIAAVPAGHVPLWEYGPLAVAFFVYLLLRRATIGETLGPTSTTWDAAISRTLAAVGLYAGKLVLPLRQSAYISALPTALPVLLAIVVLLAVLAAAVMAAWRRHERLVVLLALWMGLTLAPSLAIIVKIPAAPVAERYLYLPSVGFCLLCAYGAARALTAATGTARRVLVAACAAVIVLGSVATLRRNAVWRSNLTLWEDTAAMNTTDALPVRSLAAAYQERGDVARARTYYELALQRRNDAIGRYTIYNNLGSLAMMEKDLDTAERYYRAALSTNPNAADCLFNLGLIALTRATDASSAGNTATATEHGRRAQQLFEQAQAVSPLDPDIAVALGQTLLLLHDHTGARTQYERALQLGLPPATAESVRKLLDGRE